MKYLLPPKVHKYFFKSNEPQEIEAIRKAVETWPGVKKKSILKCVDHVDPRNLSSGYRGFALNNITTGRKDDLIESIIENGILVPLLVRKKTGILNGNHRNLIAINLGYSTVPVLHLEEVE